MQDDAGLVPLFCSGTLLHCLLTSVGAIFGLGGVEICTRGRNMCEASRIRRAANVGRAGISRFSRAPLSLRHVRRSPASGPSQLTNREFRPFLTETPFRLELPLT